MKKKILGGLLVVAIAAVAAFNVNMNTDKNELSMLALANVEALAEESSGGSGGGGESGYMPCCSMSDSKCLFNVKMGDGTTGNASLDGHYKCK